MTLKTFTRHITGDELIEACKREGFETDDARYRFGGDHISFQFAHNGIFITALYNVINGRAFGTYAPFVGRGIQFNTDDPNLDGTPWFDALLAFLYRD